MRRFFVKNLLFIIMVNVLIKPIWVFFIDRTVQNRLGHQDYGSYPQLFNLALILQIVLDFGVTNYNNRTIARHPERIGSLFPAMLSTRIILMALYMMLTLAIAYIIGYRNLDIYLLLGIVLIQVLNTALLFIRSNISALHHFKTDGLLSISDRVLMILFCGFLLLYPPTANAFKLKWFIQTQIVSYGIACIIAFFVLKKYAAVSLRFSFDKKMVLGIIKDSLPYAGLIFLMSIYMRADMILLGRLCGNAGKDQVSIYMSAYRLLDVANMLGLMFAGVLLPMFGRMLIQRQDVMPIIKMSVNMLFPVSGLVAVGAYFWSAPVMMHLYTHATLYDAHVFTWVMACFPGFCITYIYSTLLTANGSLKQLNLIAIIGVAINLGFNFYLIPKQMAMGAAITSFITQSFVALGYMYFAGSKIHVAFPAKWVSAHILYFLLLIPIAYGMLQLPLMWLWQLIIFSGIAGMGMIAFGFIKTSHIKELLAKKDISENVELP
jgi:O-antigen/teichoic acid export membrane protein